MSTIRAVKASIKDEHKAHKDYNRFSKTADKETAKLFRHIAKEEAHHEKELKKALKRVTKK